MARDFRLPCFVSNERMPSEPLSLAFFLENRVHQLNRLCNEEPIRFSIPHDAARGKLPQELRDFYGLLDGILQRVAEASESKTHNLVADFERSVVELRFSAKVEVKQAAVNLIKAIFADAEYFSGIKPLPQYTSSFAYELLFPSWLNLLSAVMLPQASSPKTRLEGARQGTLFEFLTTVHALESEGEDQLIGFLTFIASRFDAPICEELLQRLCELFSREGFEVLEIMDRMQAYCKDARQFARRLQDFLTVRHSSYKWPATSEHPIAYKRPLIRVLPDSILRRLKLIETSPDKAAWDEYFKIIRRMRFLIQSDQLLTKDCNAILQHQPQHAATILSLVVRGRDEPEFLPPEAQNAFSFLLAQEINAAENNALTTESLQRASHFATDMASRLVNFSDTTIAFFCRQFLSDAVNRNMLLEACVSQDLQVKLADFVVSKLEKLSDDEKFLEWMACVSVISPVDDAIKARTTLQAITSVRENRSIGNKEFSDLVGDMRANYQDALATLANPILSAAGKSPRVASLYMTLNEIAETFASTGKTENFSVVRAKYSRLSNM